MTFIQTGSCNRFYDQVRNSGLVGEPENRVRAVIIVQLPQRLNMSLISGREIVEGSNRTATCAIGSSGAYLFTSARSAANWSPLRVHWALSNRSCRATSSRSLVQSRFRSSDAAQAITCSRLTSAASRSAGANWLRVGRDPTIALRRPQQARSPTKRSQPGSPTTRGR